MVLSFIRLFNQHLLHHDRPYTLKHNQYWMTYESNGGNKTSVICTTSKDKSWYMSVMTSRAERKHYDACFHTLICISGHWGGGAASKSSAPVWPEETSEVPSVTQRRRHSSRHQQLNSESWIRGKSKWHQMTKHEKYTCSKLSWECGNDASNYVWCLCDEILLKVTKIKRRKGRINLLSEAGLCRYLPVYTLGCSFFFFFFCLHKLARFQ